MKHIIMLLTAFMFLLCMLNAQEPNSPTGTVTNIGIYDSRAIAVGFVGSEIYRKTEAVEIAKITEEHAAAKARGDTQKVTELETNMQTRQKKLHKQGFGTAAVDDILKHIEDQLPAIKKDAGVDIIISKWDTQSLEKHPDATQVDVTMELVDAFKPSPRQRKSALEIQKHDPVPDEQFDAKD